MIRWTHGDYVRLGRAVAEFNREIAKNTTVQNQQYLPEKVIYKELKNRIQTREGLNAYIQGLKRIKLPGGFNLEKLENGEIITTYEKKELDRGISQATASIQKQIADMEEKKKQNLGLQQLTGALKSQKQKELEARIRDYQKLYKLEGKDFRRRAKELGINQTELQYRRAYVFRKNYMQVMREKYSSMENFWIFEKWANRHKNPVNFYESLPEGQYYPDDLTYQSDSNFSEDDFNAFLEVLGMDVEAENQAKEIRDQARAEREARKERDKEWELSKLKKQKSNFKLK